MQGDKSSSSSISPPALGEAGVYRFGLRSFCKSSGSPTSLSFRMLQQPGGQLAGVGGFRENGEREQNTGAEQGGLLENGTQNPSSAPPWRTIDNVGAF